MVWMFNLLCAVPLYVLYHIQYRFLKVRMNYVRSGGRQASTRALRSMARGHLDIHLCLISLRVLSKLDQAPKQSVYELTILSYPEAFTPSHPGNEHDDTLGVTTARSTSMGGKNDDKMKVHNKQSPTPNARNCQEGGMQCCESAPHFAVLALGNFLFNLLF